MKKLLQAYNGSLSKVSRLLRIREEHLIIKNLDYILKDKLNISNCLPTSYRLRQSMSGESGGQHDSSPKFGAFPENFDQQRNNMSQDQLHQNDTVIVEENVKLPKVC